MDNISKEIGKKIISNPFYAIDIHPIFVEKHDKLIDKPTWVKANINLIKELGAEVYLTNLLSILEGNYE